MGFPRACRCGGTIVDGQCDRCPPTSRYRAKGNGGGQWHHLYGPRWRKARETHLSREPLCRACAAAGYVTSATDVDHVVPHEGDLVKFWDTRNWQSLCHSCHSEKTRAESRGKDAGLGKMSGR